MMQNIKVDVIYNQTASDFEMEFNLCGCCRMRLLSDSAMDERSFVNLLARAVSRSRIILVCGPLFGNDGVLQAVAKAIGSSLTELDAKAFGIQNETAVPILKGGTPLVTAQGIYGGCIIESGPQSILVLTENKGIRKQLMGSLIHPYIEEISRLPVEEATPAAEKTLSVEEPAAEKTGEEVSAEETVPESAEAASEEAEMPPVVNEIPMETAYEDMEEYSFLMPESEEPEMPPPEEEETIAMFTETERPKDRRFGYYEDEYIGPESDALYLADSLVGKPNAPQKKMNLAILILVLLLGACMLALFVLLVIVPLKNGSTVVQYMNDLFVASQTMLS